MEIFVKMYTGKTITLVVQPQFDVFQVKCLIYYKLKIIPYDQRLILHGKQLNDQEGTTLKYYNIIQGDTLFVVGRLTGGGTIDTLFSNLQKPVYREFTSNAPKYRIIYPGLNLEGICCNLRCKALDSKAWCKKGFGKFIINVETKKSECPLCNQKLRSVLNIGLYQGKAIIRGMKSDGKEFQKTYINKQNKLLTFQDKDETKCDWVYLQIIVEKIL